MSNANFNPTLSTDEVWRGTNSNRCLSDDLDALGVEDTTYPGCYYRTVDGATEWINSPMIVGTEYRTTERWNGKVLYTEIISCGTVTTGKNTTPTGISGITGIVKYTAHIGCIPIPYLPNGLTTADGYFATVGVQDDNIYLNVGSALSGRTAYVQIWYTKE